LKASGALYLKYRFALIENPPLSFDGKLDIDKEK
jgi:hypothetical protein